MLFPNTRGGHLDFRNFSRRRRIQTPRSVVSLLPEAVPRHDPGAEEREYRDEDRGRDG
jgi:hypothetical protein